MIAINTNTLALSTYDPDPLDVVSHGGETYFLSAGGLSKLAAGAGQEAVVGVVEWGLMDFGSLVRKNASQVVLELSGEQAATLTLVNDTLGSQVEYDYPVPAQQPYARRWPVLCGKGVTSDAIGLRFTGGDAVQWRLSGCEVNIDPRRGIR